MDLNLNESQRILKQSAREFLAAECTPALVKQMETDPQGYPPRLWQQIAGMGWQGIVIPEQYGGYGGGFLDLLVLLQETGRAALPGPFFSTAVLGGLAILEGGDDEQKKTLLPRLCGGELLLTLALTEPGVDFGLDHLATRAAKRGSRHVISGVKTFVPDAHVAKLAVCVAAGAGRGKSKDGVSAFLLDMASPGIRITPLDTNLRDRQFEVSFADVQAESSDAVGPVGGARNWLERTLEKAMLARCAEMVGAGRKLLEMTVEYAKVRVQFGKPIGTLQAIQHHVANLATCIETAELMTWRAGWMIEQGLACRADVMKAKAWTNDACKRAAALGHQVHGGIGFTREYDLYLYSGRMTTYAQLLGGTHWCHERIADELQLTAGD